MGFPVAAAKPGLCSKACLGLRTIQVKGLAKSVYPEAAQIPLLYPTGAVPDPNKNLPLTREPRAGGRAALIYVVDDDPEVIRALVALIPSLHSHWEVRGFTSGKEVLAEVQRDPPHLVLVGERIASVNGGGLLQLVGQHAPRAVRILIGAYPTDARKLAAAHQYLEPPFEPRDLDQRLGQALAAQAALETPGLGTLIAGLAAFPALPCVYADLVSELGDERGSLDRAEQLLNQDGGALTRVLQAANSLVFGGTLRISDTRAALFHLGTLNVQALVMSLHMFEGYQRASFPEMPAELLWRHSCSTAWLARELCRRALGEAAAHEAFFAGLTHDLGCLILMENHPGAFRELCQRAQHSGQPLPEAERETFHLAHEDLSAFMLRLWGMPEPVVTAVTHYNAPWEAPEPD